MRSLWNIFGSGDSTRFSLFRHGWPTANPLSGYYLLLPVSSSPSHAWLLPCPTAYVSPVTLWSCSCLGIMSGWEAGPEVEMTQVSLYSWQCLLKARAEIRIQTTSCYNFHHAKSIKLKKKITESSKLIWSQPKAQFHQWFHLVFLFFYHLVN